MCKGTTNGEDVYIIKKEFIPIESLEKLNIGWITNHGCIPVDECMPSLLPKNQKRKRGSFGSNFIHD
ncbi:hypothetical protein [Psychrobacillus antarcticus]|uniref:hypothetical protein n=1 Tax=Psychrobacillus antarcticus TaxID=2879115 RepID=UPI00240815F1|nr:hypothetical protein [Psychrobacillus antarcticus]